MKHTKMTALLVMIVALALGAFGVQAQSDSAWVRVAHLSVDAPAVDVFVDGAAVLEGVPYPAISGYLELPAGTYNIAVAPAGAGIDAAVIGPVDLTFAAGSMYTVAATGQLADGSFGPNVINETALGAGSGEGIPANVIVLHGISDAPAVDVILADGTVLISGLAFNEVAFLSVPAGDYPLLVTASGAPETVVFDQLNPVTLSAGRDYFLAAIGSFPGDFQLFAEITPYANLVDVVANTPGLEFLTDLVVSAGLADTLANGEFTVFAPTNDAFNAALNALDISAEDLRALPNLTDILLYHVAAGSVFSGTVVGLDSAPTVQGSPIDISVQDGRVILNGTVEVSVVDVLATNGVIHIIDGVLLPPAE
ncbi:MAG: DUF4397 domain-containing protein [Anaerolineae bacterium]|nr:DUF4397 domain-containing protein [Anaerolineae bacterium]